MTEREESEYQYPDLTAAMQEICSPEMMAINNAAIRVGNLFLMDRMRALSEHTFDVIEDVQAREKIVVNSEQIQKIRALYAQIAYQALSHFDKKLIFYQNLPNWEDARTRFEKMVLLHWIPLQDHSAQDNIDRLYRYTNVYTRICRSIGLGLFSGVPEFTFSGLTYNHQNSGNDLAFEESGFMAAGEDTSPSRTVEENESVSDLIKLISSMEPDDQRIINFLMSGYSPDELIAEGISPESIEAARLNLQQLLGPQTDKPSLSTTTPQDTVDNDHTTGNSRWTQTWKNAIETLSLKEIFAFLDMLSDRERLAILKITKYYRPEESVKRFRLSLQITEATFYSDLHRGIAKFSELITSHQISPHSRPIAEIISELDRFKPIYGKNFQLHLSSPRVWLTRITDGEKHFVWGNLTDKEREIISLSVVLVEEGPILRMSYSVQEIAGLTNTSLPVVYKIILRAIKLIKTRQKRPILENGMILRQNTFQYALIKRKPTLSSYKFSSLTPREREIFELATTPNPDGRYKSVESLEELFGSKSISTLLRLMNSRLEKKPWRIFRLYSGVRRALTNYDRIPGNYFKVALILKRAIGAGIPLTSAYPIIARVNGINLDIFKRWAANIIADGQRLEPHIKHPYQSVFSVKTGERETQKAVCDFAVYDEFIKQYPDLKDTFGFMLMRLDKVQEFYQDPENPILVVVDGSKFVKRIVRHKFNYLFGCYPEELPHLLSYTEEKIILLYETAEKVLGTHNPDLRNTLSDFETFRSSVRNTLDAVLQSMPEVSPKKAIKRVKEFLGLPEDGMDRMTASWSQGNLLPPDVTTYKRFVEYVYIAGLLEKYKDKLRFIAHLPSISFSPQTPTINSIHMVEDVLIDGIAQNIHALYQNDGIYFEHATLTKTRNRKELANMNFDDLDNFLRQLNKWASSFTYDDRSLLRKPNRSLSLVRTYIDRGVARAVSHFGVYPEPNPYSSLSTALSFMEDRLRRSGISKAQDMPNSSDREKFERLFLINVSLFRDLCQRERQDFSSIIDKLAQKIDERYALSAYLYGTPSSYEELVSRLVDYARKHDIRTDKITNRTFFRYFPAIENISDSNYGRRSDAGGKSRTPLRTLTKRFHTTPSQLISDVVNHLRDGP